MKTRIGFVSNSSSCSFIVSTKEFPTTWDLADYMIEARYQYEKNCYQEDICYAKRNLPKEPLSDAQKELIKEDEKLLQDNEEIYKTLKSNLSKILKGDSNLAFRSVNFDTFITQIDVNGTKYLYVSTCNNVIWDIPKTVPNGHGETIPELFSFGGLDDGEWDEEYIEGNTFIRLDDNKEIKIKDRFDGLNQKE